MSSSTWILVGIIRICLQFVMLSGKIGKPIVTKSLFFVLNCLEKRSLVHKVSSIKLSKTDRF